MRKTQRTDVLVFQTAERIRAVLILLTAVITVLFALCGGGVLRFSLRESVLLDLFHDTGCSLLRLALVLASTVCLCYQLVETSY